MNDQRSDEQGFIEYPLSFDLILIVLTAHRRLTCHLNFFKKKSLQY